MVCRKQLDPIENYDPSLVLQLDLGRGRQADVHVEHLLRADGFLRKLLCQVFNVRHGPLVRSGWRLYQCAKLASVLEIKMLGPLGWVIMAQWLRLQSCAISSQYNSRVIVYNCRAFIILATLVEIPAEDFQFLVWKLIPMQKFLNHKLYFQSCPTFMTDFEDVISLMLANGYDSEADLETSDCPCSWGH